MGRKCDLQPMHILKKNITFLKKYVHLFKENQNPNNPYYEIFLWEPSESDLSCSLTLEWTLEPHVYP